MASLKKIFPSNETFSYEALRAAGYSNYGGADIAEILAICGRIRSGNEEDWMREWRKAATRAAANARISQQVGNRTSASEGFLRASNYYRTAEFLRRKDPFNDELAVELSQLAVESFVEGVRLTGYAYEEVTIPYEGSTLPGYFLRPDDQSIRRATIVYNGGYDSTKEESWFAIAAPALKRGFNVLAFDGPGQGTALRQQRLFFRPDWEHVLTPVMDYTLSRDDVDPAKVAIFGWSMGGYLAARAATVEHRAAALILDDGVFDFGSSFRRSIPGFILHLIRNKYDQAVEQIISLRMRYDTGARWGLLNGKWTFGVTSVAELLRRLDDYTLEGRAGDIQTPCLVLDAPEDHFLKGQPAILLQKLTCKKRFVSLLAEEGAETHCHQGAFGRLHQVIFDYLGELFSAAEDANGRD